MESQYLPVSVFVVVPLVRLVLPGFSRSTKGLRWTIGLILLALGIRLADIVQTRSFYRQRLDYIANILKKTRELPGKKFIMGDNLNDKDTILQTWAFAYETLYYSALQSPDSTRTIAIFEDIDQHLWRLSNPKSFMAYGNLVPFAELPSHLFHFTDTTQTYRLIEPDFFSKSHSAPDVKK